MHISFVNGRYIPSLDASLSIEDRSTQFADAVYEVYLLYQGIIIDFDMHYERLQHSLSSLDIISPLNKKQLEIILKELMRRNRMQDGMCYLQISRGKAVREHAYSRKLVPSVVASLYHLPQRDSVAYTKGGYAITLPDIRWKRRDIKSVSLLGNVLAKQQAADEKAIEAILYEEDGMVTEGSSTNVFIVDKHNKLRTHPTNTKILAGITRHHVLQLAKENHIETVEEPFSLQELNHAKEVFITSTTKVIYPIIAIGDNMVGKGKIGPVTTLMMQHYQTFLTQQVKHNGTDNT